MKFYPLRLFVFMGCVATVLTVPTSCHRDLFDEDDYTNMALMLSPVDSIEASHDFSTTRTWHLTIVADGSAGTCKAQVLTANPVTSKTATVMAESPLTEGNAVGLKFSAPLSATAFYAALVSESGEYTVKRIVTGQQSVSFTADIVSKGMPAATPKPQMYTYCFEDEQPSVGDYDYNDLVLRISCERPRADKLLLNVTLAAVGTQLKLAAALRLVGLVPDDIDSLYTVGRTSGETFDDGYELSDNDPVLQQDGLALKGETGEMVIRLFEDAHWATGDMNLTVDENTLTRLKYNVAFSSNDEYGLVPLRTITYHLVVKDPAMLNEFTLDNLDPFVIKTLNVGYAETHIGKYEGAHVLYGYNMVTVTKLLPWALLVPNGDFHYPLDGYSMGFRKGGHLFGAYMTEGHSFGEWVEDHTKSTDWYQYPTANMIF